MTFLKSVLLHVAAITLLGLASNAYAMDTSASSGEPSFKPGKHHVLGREQLKPKAINSIREVLPALMLGSTPQVGLSLLQDGLVTIRWEAAAGNEVLLLLALHDGELEIPQSVNTPMINPGQFSDSTPSTVKVRVENRLQVISF